MALIALEMDDVSHCFGTETVLSRVSLQVKKGERIAIVGPSGQGKSTLLKILAGLIRPNQGRVFVEGRQIQELRSQERQALQCRMGMLFQKNALFDSLTVRENILFPLRETTQLKSEEMEAKMKQGLESVGLSHAIDLYPDEISGGMQKRLGIARAQALHPDFLFYDDPTAGLDPITSRKIIDLIVSLQASAQSTVLVVTNEISRAFQVGQRIWFVDKKNVLDLGSPELARNHPSPRVTQFLRGAAHGPLTAEVSE